MTTTIEARLAAEGAPEKPERLEALALDWIDDDLVLLHWPLPLAAELPRVLTDAERAVAVLALQGFSREQIARVRGRSAATVGKQLTTVYRKLGVGSRGELLARLAGR